MINYYLMEVVQGVEYQIV